MLGSVGIRSTRRLLPLPASGAGVQAQVIGLANAGGDTINSIKQAAEFGIVKGGQKLAGLLVFLTDIHALGLQTAQGLMLTETFYWDLDDQDPGLVAKKFASADGGKSPPWSTPASILGAALPEGGRGAEEPTTARRWWTR